MKATLQSGSALPLIKTMWIAYGKVHNIKICIGDNKIDIKLICEFLQEQLDLRLEEIVDQIRQIDW